MPIEEMPLRKEFQYYLDHQGELVKQHRGKYVVIRDCTVLGVYDSEMQAINSTIKTHPLGTFLVQKCEPGAESYTQTFHSRVAA
jgi:hypothetical protein